MPKLLHVLASVLNTLFPAEHIFSGQTEREESRSEPGGCMREKVAEGLWTHEGECGEGKDACVWQAARWGGPEGFCAKRKGRDSCTCEERGGTRNIVSVCVCVYMHKGLGFSSFLSPQAFPKNQGPKEPFNKT